MSNYDTKADDIVRCKECDFNPSVATRFGKHMCPMVIDINEDEDSCYYRIPYDNWFCASGAGMNNYLTLANDIVRCKDCIYNPSIAKVLGKYMCPLDVNYSKTVNHSWEISDDNWFCANGMKI